MLRIISLFLLLIISQISFADTIVATPLDNQQSALSACKSITYSDITKATGESGGSILSASVVSIPNPSTVLCAVSYTLVKWGSLNNSSVQLLRSFNTLYTCPSGYTQSDSAGNLDSSGSYCTKNSCQDLYQTSTMIPIPVGQTVTNACFDGCSASLYEGGSWTCSSDSIVECFVRVSFDGNSCSGGVDYAANASSSDSGSDSDSPPPCSAGSTTGTVNGESVTTCADDGTDSPPITDTPSSSTPTTTTSGAGSTVGSPENTSGTQNSTVGGGADSLGGEGYGAGGSAGSSGSDSGSTSSGGSDSGSTSGSGTDSGGTSSGGSDSGSTSGSGSDSGGTSSGGSDSGSTSGSGSDSGGTSSGGSDSGGTSGSGGGTDSGGTSGSGSGSDSGTGTATSGAGDTDPDIPAEEEEESGDGGGTFAAPGAGTDYLKDVFGESDLASLATDNAELTTKINQKMADVKGIFNLGTLSVSGDIPENQQEIKGASVDLSGRNIFEQLSIVAAVFYLCAIATAIYIVMGGRK